MKVKGIILIIATLLMSLCATSVYADDVPPVPHAFYGELIVNDSPAQIGTEVEARGKGVKIGIEGNPIVTSEVGKYGSADPSGSKLVVQGDITDGATITFYVNGESTGQTAEWHSGETTELDLSVTIEVPPGGGGGGGGARDTTAPRISDILASAITETTADISWRTNEKSTSQVEYWTSPGILSPLDETYVTEHHVQLTGLTPGTTYHYKTMSKDEEGNLAVSDVQAFTTKGIAPAAVFSASNLSVSPSEVDIGEEVTISVTVTNTGNLAGSYEVTLKINGAVEAAQKVTLDAGASETVTLITAKDVAGTYSVEVDELKGSFVVKEKPAAPPTQEGEAPPEVKPPINWPVVGGVIAGVIVVGLLVFFLARRRAA